MILADMQYQCYAFVSTDGIPASQPALVEQQKKLLAGVQYLYYAFLLMGIDG